MALRTDKAILDLQFEDDGVETETSENQIEVENSIDPFYSLPKYNGRIPPLKLHRQSHIAFLKRGLEGLTHHMSALDASRPWIIYWIVHGLDLLGYELTDDQKQSCINTLSRCQNPTGGFGGNIGQVSHLAPTYAAVNALCIIGIDDAFQVINRASLARFLKQMHQKDGSFTMHDGGEVDIRGAYCAASVAKLCNLDIASIFVDTSKWIKRCQTYEGGISAVPGTEAHGGYAFCGLAAATVLDCCDKLDMNALLKWSCRRQMKLEGGFQGRTNKLVDGCYSFWVGGVFPLLHGYFQSTPHQPSNFLFLTEALWDYVLICCQNLGGGLIDKPGKRPDFYHTCYCLSGLASSISCPSLAESCPLDLPKTHPIYNISQTKADKATEYFSKLDPIDS